MKKLYRVLCILCSLCLFFLPVLPASAKDEEYTYTIRFFAGKQGTFADGEEVMVFEGHHYGERVSFSQRVVTLKDNSKYYIRGIRESGKDNSESTQASSFVVTGDRDYVIAYGILGDATSYTINYVDSDGNALAPSETYYGNVGDKPVVAYLYIEGWQPQAYNMTQTLKKDPAENVFNFVYYRVPEGTPVVPPGPGPQPEPAPGEPTPEPPADGGITFTPPAPAVPEEEGGTPPVDDGTVPDDAGTPPGNEEEDIEDDPIPQNRPEEPEELEDLDEEETPTSNFLTVAADARLLGIPVPVVIVLAIGVVAAAWYFLMMRKRKKETAEEEEPER